MKPAGLLVIMIAAIAALFATVHGLDSGVGGRRIPSICLDARHLVGADIERHPDAPECQPVILED